MILIKLPYLTVPARSKPKAHRLNTKKKYLLRLSLGKKEQTRKQAPVRHPRKPKFKRRLLKQNRREKAGMLFRPANSCVKSRRKIYTPVGWLNRISENFIFLSVNME